MSSTRPRQKVSMLAAAGKRSSREISMAVEFSGLMTMSMFRFRRRSARLLIYSGLRMRAMVYRVPRFLDSRQQTIFTSSELVAATIRSASSAPAWRRSTADEPLPETVMMSMASLARWRVSSSGSMTVMLCFSRTSCSAREKPTLPQPTMMMFMLQAFLSVCPNSVLCSRPAGREHTRKSRPLFCPGRGQMVHSPWTMPTRYQLCSPAWKTSFREDQSSPSFTGSALG